MYDVLRADRCISVNSLEARVPFGDLDFVHYVMSLDPEIKINKYGKGKYLLRHAFEDMDILPDSILWREKAAFSDAVGHSMVDYLNAVKENIAGKRVIMIDDSVVRGTTCARIVKLLREAGAREVHMRVSAPPFKHPCYFGTDIDSRDNLIACQYDTVEEIAKIIGVDSLGYLSVEATHKIAEGASVNFCDGCFTGNYPMPVPEQISKNKFDQKLGYYQALD